MKKILSVFMAMVFVLATIPVSALAQSTKTPQQRAEEIMRNMTLEEKVSQMLLAYMPDSDAVSAQKENQYGGYLLFARHFKGKTKSEFKSEISKCQSASEVKMLIAVDEEGGTVVRASKYKNFRSQPYKSQRSDYKNGGLKKVKSSTQSKCKFLKGLGINTNLAPVADVPYKSSNYMYPRAFSTNANTTSKCIKTVVTQMKKDNVVSTLKHFPGYGGNGNTHNKVIRDKRSLSTFKKRDLLPFKAGISAGCDMIMFSHDIVNAFDKKNPVSISKKAHDYARKTMKFKGVIISDGLDMKGVVDMVGDSGEVAVRAVIAGNDMLCADSPEIQRDAIVKAVEDGRISQSQINQSVKRILVMKIKKGIIK